MTHRGQGPAGSPLRLVHLVPEADRSGLFTGMARHHDRSRFDLSYLVLGDPEESFALGLRSAEVPVERMPPIERAGLASACLRLAGWIRRERVGILHAHLFLPSLVGMMAARKAGVPLKLVTRHHSDYHLRRKKWIHVALDRMTMDLSNGVVAVSDHTRDHLVARERVSPTKARTIHNGILEDRIPPPDPEVTRRLRKSLGLASGFSVLLPGRLHPEKGTDILFRALRSLRRKGLQVRLLLAGEGPFRASFEKDVRELGIQDSVSFLGFRGDVVPLMRAVDLVVLPSRVEAFGLAALEAVAAGAVLVAARVGGIPEIVQHGKNGVLVQPENEGELASTIEALLLSRERKGTILANTGPAILERFALRDMVAGYEEFYVELLADA